MKLITKAVYMLLPLCFWLMVMLSFDSISICIMTILSALLHELGHIGAFIFLKSGKITLPRAVINGLKIHTGSDLSYFEEFLITLMGPLINIIIFIIALPFYSRSEYIFTFGVINLLCAVSNLLPIKGYDGYGIISSFICLKSKLPMDKFLDFISLIFTALITLLSAIFIFIIGEGYWIFIVFFTQLTKEILGGHH